MKRAGIGGVCGAMERPEIAQDVATMDPIREVIS